MISPFIRAETSGAVLRIARETAALTPEERQTRDAYPGGRYPPEGITQAEAAARCGRPGSRGRVWWATAEKRSPHPHTVASMLSALYSAPYAVAAGDGWAVAAPDALMAERLGCEPPTASAPPPATTA